MEGYLPIDKDLMCNFLECAGGCGVSGNGHCFLGGDPELKDCAEFISEDDFLRKMEDDAKKAVE